MTAMLYGYHGQKHNLAVEKTLHCSDWLQIGRQLVSPEHPGIPDCAKPPKRLSLPMPMTVSTQVAKLHPAAAHSAGDALRQVLRGSVGLCAGQRVFLGFAPASLLARLSFADVLDEQTRSGYQRRFCKDHSLAFKRYIQTPGAATIPLTFNLRAHEPQRWWLREVENGISSLELECNGPPPMAQVDCQHRLGFMRDSPVSFPFMAFIGLSVEREMQIFRDINGKAKGLSGSLLDYTDAVLAQKDLAVAHPAIALALRMQEDARSPWRHRLDLGGERTTGLHRIASLRTMQKAVRLLLRELPVPWPATDQLAAWLVDYWVAVTRIYPVQWAQPRKFLLAKGIGVYSLSALAGELIREGLESGRLVSEDYFMEKLSDFADQIDWSANGSMKGYGGSAGATMAHEAIKSARAQSRERLWQAKEFC